MKAMIGRKAPTTGGVNLATDVYLPGGPGPFPVLLTRTPYHRGGGAAKGYTDWGYAYVVQDCRGKYDSEGTFRPLVYEVEDGAATLDWIANQSWCNGRIGMVGLSYLGIVQVPAAACGHEALRCIVPGVAPASHFIDWLRYDGCFALANSIRWALDHAVCATKPSIDHFTHEELWRMKSLDEVFERVGFEAPELRKWVDHDAYDEYWEAIDQHRMYPSVKAAGLHPAGWFDHISRGQFQAYQGIRDIGASERARANQRLLVGPWGHTSMGQAQYGEWTFGDNAKLDLTRYGLRFCDLWLRDIDDGISDEPPVLLFVMGRNEWVHFGNWPIPGADEQSWYLGEGELSRQTPGACAPDRYRYDPADPVPTLGGPIYWGMDRPAGPIDQRELLGRQDVLYWRSERLPRETAVIGPLATDLWVASDAEDTDFIAKLCVVEPKGCVTCLALGSLRCRCREGWDRRVPLPAGEPVRIRIDMGNLAYVFPPGSRIALTVTSSSFPRILPHPNTMAPTWTETSPKVATNEVLHDRQHPSRLLLPVVEL